MIDILLIAAGTVAITICLFAYTKCREEAKADGYVSDDYIENNEEDNEDDKH